MTKSMGFRLLLSICLLGCTSAAVAGIYKCTRADGKVAFQDQPCAANETSRTIATQAAQQDSSDPLMAAAIVHGIATSIDQLQQWCGRIDPDSVYSIGPARNDWRSRHHALLDKSQGILRSRLSSEEKSKLDSQMKLVGQAVVGKLAMAEREEQLRICLHAPLAIESAEMDLNSRRLLVKALGGGR